MTKKLFPEEIQKLRPEVKRNLIDLVESAGFDTTEWSFTKSGKPTKTTPSRNGRFCYEWAFYDKSSVLLLNLWFERCEIKSQEIFQTNNYRSDYFQMKKNNPSATARIKRAKACDGFVREAFYNQVPVRVIFLDGGIGDVDGKPSRPKLRDLDSSFWKVTSYDDVTGEHTIVRYKESKIFIDQFSLPPEEQPVSKSYAESNNYSRSPQVRNWVLRRANGNCEFCGEKGFLTNAGSIYLETHHIISLSERGADSHTNVIALCPNDHRRAHFSREKEQLKTEFKNIIEQKQ